MPYMVEAGTVLRFESETMEFTATPGDTGDRYRLTMTVTPGGGPGIKGFGPHIHDGTTEAFTIVSGTMRYRLGRDVSDVGAGTRVEVPPGAVHGFVNPGDEPLVAEVEIIFGPDGPDPADDPVPIGVIVARLIEEGPVSRITGYPPILQLAVVEAGWPRGMREAGLAGVVMPVLARLGRLRGYRPNPFASE